MGFTALQAQGEGLGATSVSEYRGATTAARFGNPQAEFVALRTGCGVYDLGFRAKISLTGVDRVRWLNGMVTNNIRDLAAGHGVYAFLLNPQGRILGDLYAYNRGESIVVDSKDQARLEAGDFSQALEDGSIHWADVHELGQVIVGRYTGAIVFDPDGNTALGSL